MVPACQETRRGVQIKKEVGKNGILVVEDVKTMSELFSFLGKMKRAAV